MKKMESSSESHVEVKREERKERKEKGKKREWKKRSCIGTE